MRELIDDRLLLPEELKTVTRMAEEYLCAKGEDPYVAVLVVGAEALIAPTHVPDVVPAMEHPDPAMRFALGCMLLFRQIAAMSAIIGDDDLYHQFRSRWAFEPDEFRNHRRIQ